MRVNTKEEIIRELKLIEPDDFDSLKIKCGQRYHLIGSWTKLPDDEIYSLLFDLSLSRSVSSISLTDGGTRFPSYLVIGTTPCRDFSTNIDPDIIEAIWNVMKRRIEVKFPTTKKYKQAEEIHRKEEKQRKKDKQSVEDEFSSCLDNPFWGELGMP